MECNVVKDLIGLFVDDRCTDETKELVAEHVENCPSCKKFLQDTKAQAYIVSTAKAPVKMSKLNDWKASVMQSILLFLSFAVITLGVTLEARTPYGHMNGFWTVNLILPATGFMLSLASWYFVRVYRSRKIFSDCSLLATLAISLCAYIWAIVHYKMNIFAISGVTGATLPYSVIGIVLTAVFCVLSKTLSNQYAKMLGKE